MSKMTRLIGFAVLVTIMLLSPTANVSAALVRCRTDPIFVLSNGDMISVTLDISTTAANVRNISYDLHVPAGVTVKKVAYTAINLRIPESYRVYQDSPAKTYTVNTVVTTQTSGSVGVTVYGRINSGITKSVSGYSSQHLYMALIRPR
jgi:hypothetical protein